MTVAEQVSEMRATFHYFRGPVRVKDKFCVTLTSVQGWKPEDLKVHVSWEFALSDNVQKGTTKAYKGGINPDIFEQFRVDIGNRTARSFARAIKRGSFKATIYYDRGFLKKAGESLSSGTILPQHFLTLEL